MWIVRMMGWVGLAEGIGTADVAVVSGVITWKGSSGDSVCRPHANPNRFASRHGVDPSIPQSAYRVYESAAEVSVRRNPGFLRFPLPHAVVPAIRAPFLSSPPIMLNWACRLKWDRSFGWQETESRVHLNPRMDHSVRRQSPAENRLLPYLHHGIMLPLHV